MRTKLAALITATAVALAPVSVANAKTNSSEITNSVKKSSNKSSSDAKSLEIPSSSDKGKGGKSSLPTLGLGDNPTENFLLDLAVSLGIWAIAGSIYGAVVAPHLPKINIYDMLPFLRG